MRGLRPRGLFVLAAGLLTVWLAAAEAHDAFTDTPDDLWRRVLRRQPDPLRWVAWYPPDPDLN